MAKESSEKRMTERLAAINELLAEKEHHLLTFVYGQVPRPYYVRWKEESNAIFSMVVALKKRRHAMRRGA